MGLTEALIESAVISPQRAYSFERSGDIFCKRTLVLEVSPKFLNGKSLLHCTNEIYAENQFIAFHFIVL